MQKASIIQAIDAYVSKEKTSTEAVEDLSQVVSEINQENFKVAITQRGVELLKHDRFYDLKNYELSHPRSRFTI